MPAHLGAVPGRQPQEADGKGEACQADAPVGSVVVAKIGLVEHDARDQSDENERAGEEAPFGWHGIRLAGDGSSPQFRERYGKPTRGDMP